MLTPGSRKALAVVAAVTGGAALAAVTAGGAGATGPSVTTALTDTSPGLQSWIVPIGVTQLTVTAVGAAGGSCASAAGGKGAEIVEDVSVSAGEPLQLGVGGAGANCSAGGQTPNGGTGGGGSGGSTPNSSHKNGAGGGGASLVGQGSPTPGFSGLLAVAGGGGGASDTAGFNAGAGGSGDSGGAGTQSAGGAGGVGNAGSGSVGTFGVGGAGENTSGFGAGGGGGGGGYYGGGGGAIDTAATVGFAGGGGSSFPASGNVSGPAASTNSAQVVITYDVPTATLSATALTFAGTTPLGTAGTPQALTVTNNGSAPLIVSGYELSGADAGDFFVDDGCQAPVALGGSCTLNVVFEPSAAGSRGASLVLLTNVPAASAPSAVGLSGMGGSLPSGPAGPTGPTGPTGATGPRGPAGRPGSIELVTCHATVHKQHGHKKTVQVCKTKTVTGTVTFKTTSALARATLSRDGRVYASGARLPDGFGTELVLTPRRRLRPGRYTLTLRTARRTVRQPITLT